MSDQEPQVLKTLEVPLPVVENQTAQTAQGLRAGDSVLLKVKHLHGYHATVIGPDANGVIVRINEGNLGGVLAKFSSSELVQIFPGTTRHQTPILELHQNERLPWDYKD